MATDQGTETKAAKTKTAKKTAKKSAKKAGSKGKRYSHEMKQKVIDFVHDLNAKKGRGGIAAAARQFGVTALTIGNWIKGQGRAPAATKAPRGKQSSGSVWDQLVELKARIDQLEGELAAKQAEFDKLKTKI